MRCSLPGELISRNVIYYVLRLRGRKRALVLGSLLSFFRFWLN